MPALIHDLKRLPSTAMIGVNNLYRALLDDPGFAAVDTRHLKLANASGMAVQRVVAERWRGATDKMDMVIVSGFKVFPNQVEDAVALHPGVAEVGAVGVPDERSGEAVKIVVVRKDPGLTEQALLAHCRQHLTGYKVPSFIEFRTEPLPKSNLGKILRRELRSSTALPQPASAA